MKFYIVIEKITEDTFYDVAHVHVGFIEDKGILIKLPIPKTLNNEIIDSFITQEISKIFEYTNETMLRWIVQSKKGE
jgi:hypothetical protein